MVLLGKCAIIIYFSRMEPKYSKVGGKVIFTNISRRQHRNLGRERHGENPLAFGGNFPALIKEKSWLAVAQLCNHRYGAVCSLLERHKFAVNHSTISLLGLHTLIWRHCSAIIDSFVYKMQPLGTEFAIQKS